MFGRVSCNADSPLIVKRTTDCPTALLLSLAVIVYENVMVSPFLKNDRKFLLVLYVQLVASSLSCNLLVRELIKSPGRLSALRAASVGLRLFHFMSRL